MAMLDKLQKMTERQWLAAIVLLGFLLRLAFVLKGATIYYGAGQEHLNGDSFSYIDSFLNLWHTGHYTSEPLIPDASFGRLPGYPFFYGLHHLIFGSAFVLQAIAGTQLLLDTSVIVLIYSIVRKWTGLNVWPARLAAFLYATYPFAILWVTIAGSETLNTFCSLVWLSMLTRYASSRRHYIAVGILGAVTFYVRTYMGILVPISMLFVLFWPLEGCLLRWQRATWVAVGFGALYVWWPMRNYINHGRIVVVTPISAGYANQREDMQSYLDWLACWTNDNTTWLQRTLAEKPFRYPAAIFADPLEEQRAYALTTLAARCGGSFHLFRIYSHEYCLSQPPYFISCSPKVAVGFDSLRSSYIRRNPVQYYVTVPLANLRKAFFKSTTFYGGSHRKVLLQRVLFLYRSLLLIMGVSGLVVYRRRIYLWPVAAFFGFIYYYLSFVFRSLEMRYLLQADIFMLLPAALLIAQLARLKFANRGTHK